VGRREPDPEGALNVPLAPSIWEARGVGPDAIRLDGRSALVTGAAAGIGKACAVALARFGADLALCDRDEAGLEATRAEIEKLGRPCTTGALDVREGDAVRAFVERVAEGTPRLDVLVNNAGGGFAADFLDVSEKGESALVRENFSSVTHFVRACVPQMSEGGSIVNVTSVEAHRAGPGFAIYSAMKAAVANLTRTLAMELAPRRIRVNCIAPDMIPTPGDGQLEADSGATALGAERHAWPESGHPDDCAGAVVFLASDLSRFVTGSTIHVDGGTWAAGGWKRTEDDRFVL